jgi:signal transduction histidine kinase/ActR/RegA family two-component response regulator
VWWSNGGDGAGLDAATLERFPHRSGLFVPMVGTGGPIGGLFLITWDHDRAYTLDEIRLVEGITRQAAIFTENARLYAAATRRRREAEELAGLARMITESLDVADVGQRTVDSARQLLDAESSTLRTLQPDGALRLIACSGPPSVGMTLGAIAPPGVGVVGRVIATGAPVWAADVLQDLGSTFPDEIRTPMLRTGARAVLAVPLRAKRQIIGVLTVGDRAPREFAESEVTLLQTFADQAAIALENGRLYGELQDALAAVEQSRERVVRGERLRALGEMAGGVAHDFNNLLTVIVGRAEALLEDATDPEVRRQAGVIIKVAEDAAQTVRRIQEFTRMRRARPFQRVDVSQLVAEVIDVTRSRWKEDAQARSIRYEVVAETVPVPAVIGDPSEIREALTNLLFNALDAMPGGGCVVIRTAVEDGRVLCTVADSGVGMTEDVRDRVFDPFFTTKGERGTGLGLSVVWGIVSRHGGEVDVQSHPGKGSVFTIRLPLPETPPAAAPSHTISRTVAAAKVLVVDDEDDVREALRDLLVRDGHRVVMCANGESALERFEAEAFDLVVTDLGMPRTTGWDVARAVKLRAPATPVVMVTGWGDHFDQDDAGKRGVDAVIAKPFRRDDLRVAVATALSRAASRGSPSGPGASPGSVPKSKGIP